MSKVFKISARQKFTDDGKIGAYMFVISPILAAGLYAWMINEFSNRISGNPYLPATLLLLPSITFLISVPMMLIGRSQDAIVTVTETKPTNEGG